MNSELRASYRRCKKLNSQHGKTYYLATLFLPRAKRKYVHALYGFARYADEIVDDLSSTLTIEEKTEALTRWSDGVLSDLRKGSSSDAIGMALVDTVRKFNIPIAYFSDFIDSMKMDLRVTSYPNFEALSRYVHGSADVIGLQMAPILGYSDERALIAAQKLGSAFQLANFIRDVGEDLDRGRIYIPLDELAQFGVTPEMLYERVLTPEIVEVLKYQIARVRQLQREAEPGIELLDATSRPCIKAASELYCGIVDEVEAIDFDIFNERAKTSTARRLKVALRAYPAAVIARIR